MYGHTSNQPKLTVFAHGAVVPGQAVAVEVGNPVTTGRSVPTRVAVAFVDLYGQNKTT